MTPKTASDFVLNINPLHERRDGSTDADVDGAAQRYHQISLHLREHVGENIGGDGL